MRRGMRPPPRPTEFHVPRLRYRGMLGEHRGNLGAFFDPSRLGRCHRKFSTNFTQFILEIGKIEVEDRATICQNATNVSVHSDFLL